MTINVLKRDGRLCEYDITKIENAIMKAMNAIGRNDAKGVLHHQMNVENDIRARAEFTNQGIIKRLRGNKMPIHHIQMDKLSSRFFHFLDFLL